MEIFILSTHHIFQSSSNVLGNYCSISNGVLDEREIEKVSKMRQSLKNSSLVQNDKISLVQNNRTYYTDCLALKVYTKIFLGPRKMRMPYSDWSACVWLERNG